MQINPYNLYLASWEHLYLVSGRVPAGLPNQLFSQQPWALILFENIYCDKHGFLGEQRAAESMGWTNSKLFVELARHKIIVPLAVQHSLPVSEVRQSFRAEFKLSVDKAVSQDDQAIDERMFARTRQQLLQPFLETNRLVLYDLPLSRLSGSVPVIMKEAVTDILKAEMRAVPLAIDVFTELPSAYKPVFEELQNFEREPLRHLRAGRIDQEEYLKHLKEKVREHREIDVRLSDGLPKRLDRILTLRNRFGERGGWQTVQDFLAAYDRAAPVEELAELERELDEKLLFCHKPLPTEFGRVLIRLTKTLSKLYPAVHYAEIVSDAYRDAESLKPLLNELMTYFRGDVRGHGGRA